MQKVYVFLGHSFRKIYNVHKPNDNLQESEELMDYNLIMYIGVGLMVGGFGLFLFSEMKIREIDRKMAENQRFIDAMLRVKK